MTDIKCLNDSCNQNLTLYQTGYSAEQGPTHYCRVCGWGFWSYLVKPSADDLKKAKQVNPNITEEQLTHYILKPFPRVTAWGDSVERAKAKQLGGKSPWWLSDSLKKICREKYYEIYPSKRPKEEGKN